MNYEVIENIKRLGITESDAVKLRRISMTLHRWHELECGNGDNSSSWSIERDDTTDKPYFCRYMHDGKNYRSAIPDREKGAKRRLAETMQSYPELTAYIQTDPRGAALYIVPNDRITGPIDSCYSNGTAVHK